MEDVNIKVCGESVKVTESEKLLRLVINGEMTRKHYLHGESWRSKKTDNFKGLIPRL